MTSSDRPLDADTRARLTLLALDHMGPARLRWLLGDGTDGTDGTDEDERNAPAALEAVRRGRFPDAAGPPPPGLTRSLLERWQRQVPTIADRVEQLVDETLDLGAAILSPRDPRWPFGDDPEPPGLVFLLGNPDLLATDPAVAIVGTRRCTSLGRTVAYELGRDLALAGATVVSGLALGVDGAAHRGALDHGADVIGVVAGGLDVVYPRANRALWDEVGERGLLLSEVPVGRRPDRWRFPARNRLIAALSEATVVVESHERGGALSTAEEAIRRDRAVMAVPGSVLSSASKGTNSLLVDGAVPVRDAIDVLAYLGRPLPPETARPPSSTGRTTPATLHLASSSGDGADEPAQTAEPEPRSPGPNPESLPTTPPSGRPQPAPPAGSVAARVLAEVATGPMHLDDLVATVGLTVADLLVVVQELQAADLVELDGSTVNLPRPWSP